MPRSLALIIIAAALSSCGHRQADRSGLDVYHDYDRPAARPRDPSAVVVKVSTSRQRVYVMEDDRPLLVMPVSVGTRETPTPSGAFRVTDKSLNKRDPKHGFTYSGDRIRKSSRSAKPSGWSFKGRPLPYWVGFQPTYGFHTGWIKHTPCTNGCIRMHRNLAPKFYELVGIGTPVRIAVTQPEDARYGSIPLPPDAGPLPDYTPSYYLSDEPFSDHKAASFE